MTIIRQSIRSYWIIRGILFSIFLSILTPCIITASLPTQGLDNVPPVAMSHLSHRIILYVGGSGPNNYTKIQDAIENASTDDTIFVYHGIYYEHVLLNKKVTLIGEDRDQTIIDGSNTGNGIKITTDGVTVQRFTLQNAGIGLYIVHSSHHSIIQNRITENWEGIGLLDSSHNLISENIVTHNSFEGINLVQTISSIFSYNTIVDHLEGIYLVESSANTIVANNFSSNSRGIAIEQSSNNNKMFHNNFFSSAENNAYDKCSNIWDDGYPSGGNYWDDYTGGDANHDGIGDIPYTIPGGAGNKDHYPLMEPWNQPMNQPPLTPSIQGETNGVVGKSYEYTFVTTDPEGDNVYYFIDWGDQTNSGWIGPYPSGDERIQSHTWNKKGTYSIKIKAKDINNAESEWGSLSVTMPKNHFFGGLPFYVFVKIIMEKLANIFFPLRFF